MRKVIGVIILIAVLSLARGYPKETTDLMEAIEAVDHYLEITYEVPDHTALDITGVENLFALNDEYEERAAAYATQEMIQVNISNRFPLGIAQAAVNRGCDIGISSKEKDQFNQDGDKIYMDYKITLVLTYEDGTHEEVIKNGKLQVIKIEGEWKVNHEKSNSYPILMMSYEFKN